MEQYLWLILLLCPLMHIFMMRGHGNQSCHGKNDNKNDNKTDQEKNQDPQTVKQ